MTRRFEKELCVIPCLCDMNRSNKFAACRQYIVWQISRFGEDQNYDELSTAVVFAAFEINIHIQLDNTEILFRGEV